MTTVLEPARSRAEPSAQHVAEPGVGPEAVEKRRCECPNDHRPLPRWWNRLIPDSSEASDRCIEVARWWARLTASFPVECDEVLALCTACLDQWLDAPDVTVVVLGQVTGSLGLHNWPGEPPPTSA